MLSRLAIIAPNAWPAIDPRGGQRVGGMETFAWGLARGLACIESLDVSLLVRTTRRIDARKIDGVTIAVVREPLRQWRYEVAERVSRVDGFPWVRVHRWDASLAWQIPALAIARCVRRRTPAQQFALAVEQLEADAILALGVGAESATALQVARRGGSKGLLWLRSNADIEPRFFEQSEYRNIYGVTSDHCRTCLELADQVICQTKWQQRRLKELAHIESTVIRNPVDLEKWRSQSSWEQREHVLWIGRYDRHHKRPLACLDAARQLPHIPFVMIVNRGDDTVEQEVRRQVPPNVRLINYVPHDQLVNYFTKSRLFLSTGTAEHEGFPNVLLEAAASSTPIVSMQDFDDFLAQSGAGTWVNDDPPALVSELQSLWTDQHRWNECSAAGRRYVEQHHRRDSTYQAFAKLLRRICQSTSSQSSPADPEPRSL
ncbi:MAG: glycosyltransferase family 4 protein [Planctomycetales bacterium]|nr:glycosyltransferase family 4 protein [Planctomycetales bacterium]